MEIVPVIKKLYFLGKNIVYFCVSTNFQLYIFERLLTRIVSSIIPNPAIYTYNNNMLSNFGVLLLENNSFYQTKTVKINKIF